MYYFNNIHSFRTAAPAGETELNNIKTDVRAKLKAAFKVLGPLMKDALAKAMAKFPVSDTSAEADAIRAMLSPLIDKLKDASQIDIVADTESQKEVATKFFEEYVNALKHAEAAPAASVDPALVLKTKATESKCGPALATSKTGGELIVVIKDIDSTLKNHYSSKALEEYKDLAKCRTQLALKLVDGTLVDATATTSTVDPAKAKDAVKAMTLLLKVRSPINLYFNQAEHGADLTKKYAAVQKAIPKAFEDISVFVSSKFTDSIMGSTACDGTASSVVANDVKNQIVTSQEALAAVDKELEDMELLSGYKGSIKGFFEKRDKVVAIIGKCIVKLGELAAALSPPPAGDIDSAAIISGLVSAETTATPQEPKAGLLTIKTSLMLVDTDIINGSPPEAQDKDKVNAKALTDIRPKYEVLEKLGAKKMKKSLHTNLAVIISPVSTASTKEMKLEAIEECLNLYEDFAFFGGKGRIVVTLSIYLAIGARLLPQVQRAANIIVDTEDAPHRLIKQLLKDDVLTAIGKEMPKAKAYFRLQQRKRIYDHLEKTYKDHFDGDIMDDGIPTQAAKLLDTPATTIMAGAKKDVDDDEMKKRKEYLTNALAKVHGKTAAQAKLLPDSKAKADHINDVYKENLSKLLPLLGSKIEREDAADGDTDLHEQIDRLPIEEELNWLEETEEVLYKSLEGGNNFETPAKCAGKLQAALEKMTPKNGFSYNDIFRLYYKDTVLLLRIKQAEQHLEDAVSAGAGSNIKDQAKEILVSLDALYSSLVSDPDYGEREFGLYLEIYQKFVEVYTKAMEHAGGYDPKARAKIQRAYLYASYSAPIDQESKIFEAELALLESGYSELDPNSATAKDLAPYVEEVEHMVARLTEGLVKLNSPATPASPTDQEKADSEKRLEFLDNLINMIELPHRILYNVDLVRSFGSLIDNAVKNGVDTDPQHLQVKNHQEAIRTRVTQYIDIAKGGVAAINPDNILRSVQVALAAVSSDLATDPDCKAAAKNLAEKAQPKEVPSNPKQAMDLILDANYAMIAADRFLEEAARTAFIGARKNLLINGPKPAALDYIRELSFKIQTVKYAQKKGEIDYDTKLADAIEHATTALRFLTLVLRTDVGYSKDEFSEIIRFYMELTDALMIAPPEVKNDANVHSLWRVGKVQIGDIVERYLKDLKTHLPAAKADVHKLLEILDTMDLTGIDQKQRKGIVDAIIDFGEDALSGPAATVPEDESKIKAFLEEMTKVRYTAKPWAHDDIAGKETTFNAPTSKPGSKKDWEGTENVQSGPANSKPPPLSKHYQGLKNYVTEVPRTLATITTAKMELDSLNTALVETEHVAVDIDVRINAIRAELNKISGVQRKWPEIAKLIEKLTVRSNLLQNMYLLLPTKEFGKFSRDPSAKKKAAQPKIGERSIALSKAFSELSDRNNDVSTIAPILFLETQLVDFVKQRTNPDIGDINSDLTLTGDGLRGVHFTIAFGIPILTSAFGYSFGPKLKSDFKALVLSIAALFKDDSAFSAIFNQADESKKVALSLLILTTKAISPGDDTFKIEHIQKAVAKAQEKRDEAKDAIKDEIVKELVDTSLILPTDDEYAYNYFDLLIDKSVKNTCLSLIKEFGSQDLAVAKPKAGEALELAKTATSQYKELDPLNMIHYGAGAVSCVCQTKDAIDTFESQTPGLKTHVQAQYTEATNFLTGTNSIQAKALPAITSITNDATNTLDVYQIRKLIEIYKSAQATSAPVSDEVRKALRVLDVKIALEHAVPGLSAEEAIQAGSNIISATTDRQPIVQSPAAKNWAQLTKAKAKAELKVLNKHIVDSIDIDNKDTLYRAVEYFQRTIQEKPDGYDVQKAACEFLQTRGHDLAGEHYRIKNSLEDQSLDRSKMNAAVVSLHTFLQDAGVVQNQGQNPYKIMHDKLVDLKKIAVHKVLLLTADSKDATLINGGGSFLHKVEYKPRDPLSEALAKKRAACHNARVALAKEKGNAYAKSQLDVLKAFYKSRSELKTAAKAAGAIEGDIKISHSPQQFVDVLTNDKDDPATGEIAPVIEQFSAAFLAKLDPTTVDLATSKTNVADLTDIAKDFADGGSYAVSAVATRLYETMRDIPSNTYEIKTIGKAAAKAPAEFIIAVKVMTDLFIVLNTRPTVGDPDRVSEITSALKTLEDIRTDSDSATEVERKKIVQSIITNSIAMPPFDANGFENIENDHDMKPKIDQLKSFT